MFLNFSILGYNPSKLEKDTIWSPEPASTDPAQQDRPKVGVNSFFSSVFKNSVLFKVPNLLLTKQLEQTVTLNLKRSMLESQLYPLIHC